MFAPSPISPQRLHELLAADPVCAQREVRLNRRRWQAALLALAASLLLVVSVWQFLPEGPAAPFFQPRSIVQIYRETVDAGFEPYYECHDPQRFADTFARRQDQPLLLAAMPADRRMLGLSYPGGFTRDTTAMLCRVNDQPVVVFVDRATADLLEFATTRDATLHVHRVEKLGLVFYEVGPFDSPQMIEYFVAP